MYRKCSFTNWGDTKYERKKNKFGRKPKSDRDWIKVQKEKRRQMSKKKREIGVQIKKGKKSKDKREFKSKKKKNWKIVNEHNEKSHS